MNTCEIKNANTGGGRCKFDWGQFQRVILTPIGAKFTGLDASNNPQTFDEWIMAGIQAAKPEDRFYPMPQFSDNEDNSEDPTEWTDGYGNKFTIRDGAMAFTQSYLPNYCQTNRISTFNDGIRRRAIIWDNRNKMWGTTNNGDFQGFEVQVWSLGTRPTGASELSEPKIKYSMVKTDEVYKKFAHDTDLEVVDTEGLEDIEMVAVKSSSDVHITFRTMCGGQDVTAEMKNISGVAGCWLLDGVAFGTAPTFSAANGYFTVAYTVVSGGTTIKIADPSVLAANSTPLKEVVNSVAVASLT